MERVTLITGATGLVGNNVVRQLLARGERVRVLARQGADPRPLEGLHVELVTGDVRDAEAVGRACRGVACVIHAAGYVHLGRTKLHLHRAINVEGSLHVARAVRSEGSRLIHVSTCDAVGVGTAGRPADEDTPLKRPVCCSYVISKREAEQIVLEEVDQGLDAVIVNPSFMLGPWDWKPSSGRMLLEVARGRGVLAPRGTLSICDVRDVADAILAAVDHGLRGRRYILAGETMSFLAAWRLFAEVSGGRRPWFCPGPVVQWLGGHLGDALGWITGSELDLNSGAIALARLSKYYSSERAHRELGYRTRPVLESIRDAWEWFRQYGYA